MKRNNFIIAILFLVLSSYSYSQTLEERIERETRELKRECKPFSERGQYSEYRDCIRIKALLDNNIVAINAYPPDSVDIRNLETIELAIKAFGNKYSLVSTAFNTLTSRNEDLLEKLEPVQKEFNEYKAKTEKWYGFIYSKDKLTSLASKVNELQTEFNANEKKRLYYEELLLNRIKEKGIDTSVDYYFKLAKDYIKKNGGLDKAILIFESIANAPKYTNLKNDSSYPYYQFYSSEFLAREAYKRSKSLPNDNEARNEAFKFAERSYDLINYYQGQYASHYMNFDEALKSAETLGLYRTGNYSELINIASQEWLGYFFIKSHFVPLAYPIILYENSLENKDFDNIDKAIKIMYDICNNNEKGIFKGKLDEEMHEQEIDIACKLHYVMNKEEILPYIDLMYDGFIGK
ncbi:hypothetical protein [Glaesserella parasuis]|uniref:hypothetical protein n=1 Tax=Glaesserella parasuis TaxID=738 RepID=UPI0003AC0AD8|nr:hypothetical protein [Glaesserella parasuis]EQA00338.1 hypothetical protein HPSSW114_1687 [Glaesserella parasuis SW114]MDD2173322.1 hypothetical protein [Glaesserella parasuis]MDG6448487.1 hypothetical protein [Glaesserella parasuis]MDG6476304.1 hypothetical protein [Glaesserella parasuis]MDP0272654.1 hypothetical protein [Glaesserella parasuis]